MVENKLYLFLGVSGLKDELHLLRDLLVEYDTAARPVVNSSEVVELHMGIALFQIRELDEKNQFLQVNVWFQFVSWFSFTFNETVR